MGASCCVLLFPNVFTTNEISEYIIKNLYEDYLKKIKK